MRLTKFHYQNAYLVLVLVKANNMENILLYKQVNSFELPVMQVKHVYLLEFLKLRFIMK